LLTERRKYRDCRMKTLNFWKKSHSTLKAFIYGGRGGGRNTIMRSRVGSPMAFKMLLETYSKDAASTGHWLRLRNSSTLEAVVLSSLVVVARLHQVAYCIRKIDKKKIKRLTKHSTNVGQKNIKQHKTQQYYYLTILFYLISLSISFCSPWDNQNLNNNPICAIQTAHCPHLSGGLIAQSQNPES